MKLAPHQRRILEWIADDKNPRTAQAIADGCGTTYNVVISATTVLKNAGYVEKVLRLTDGGKELFSA